MWTPTSNEERDGQPTMDAGVLAREDSVMLAKDRMSRASKSNTAEPQCSPTRNGTETVMEEDGQLSDSLPTHDILPQLTDTVEQPSSTGATKSSALAEAAMEDMCDNNKTADGNAASPGKVRFSKVVEPVP